MKTADEPSAFSGWHRPSSAHPWRRVVEAESESEAWAMLLGAVTGGDQMVTASHRDPNHPDHAIDAEFRRART